MVCVEILRLSMVTTFVVFEVGTYSVYYVLVFRVLPPRKDFVIMLLVLSEGAQMDIVLRYLFIWVLYRMFSMLR